MITAYTAKGWIDGLNETSRQDLINLLDFLYQYNEVNFNLGDRGIRLNLLTDLGIKTPILIFLLNGLVLNQAITIYVKSRNNKPLFRLNNKSFHNSDNRLHINSKKLKRLIKLSKDEKGTSQIVNCCGLVYDTKKFTLSYAGKNKIKEISTNHHVIKFFLTLFARQGEKVQFKEIAKAVNSSNFDSLSQGGKIPLDQLNNKDFYEEIGFLRRDFRELALSLGMPKELFRKMVVRVVKIGYRLNCKNSQ